MNRRTAMVVLLVVSLTGCTTATSGVGQPVAPTTAPAATLASVPAEDGPIEPGTYRIPSSAWSVADFGVTIPEGWEVQHGHIYTKHMDEPDEIGFYAVVVDDIFADACGDAAVPMGAGPGVDDLVTALLGQQGPEAGDPVDTALGDHPATRIELTVPESLDLGACRLEGAGLQIWYSAPVDKYFVLLPEWIADVYVLDIDGKRQVFVTTHRPTTPAPELTELQTVLDSIHFET